MGFQCVFWNILELMCAVPVPLHPPDTQTGVRSDGEPRRIGESCVYAGRCPCQIRAVCEGERLPWRDIGGV